MKIKQLFNYIDSEYKTNNWWPHESRFEIVVGAVLTQNTNWNNVEKAINNLKAHGLMNSQKIINASNKEIEKLIKPSGYYVQKTKTLKRLCIALKNKKILRNELLNVKGIGPETADSILLYAFDKPEFVVDVYTKRLFSRLDIIKSNKYDEIKKMVEKSLKGSAEDYKRFHGAIVEHSKKVCKKSAKCNNCFLQKKCKKIIIS